MSNNSNNASNPNYNPINLQIYQNEPNNPGTPIPIPQQEVSRGSVNTGIVTGIAVAVILWLCFRPFERRGTFRLSWWVKLLIVAIVAWFVDVWIFRMFFPVTASSFPNTTPLFDSASVIAAVGTYAVMDIWGQKSMIVNQLVAEQDGYAYQPRSRRHHHPRVYQTAVYDEE